MPDDDVLADRYEQADAMPPPRPASTGTRCPTGPPARRARCRHNELYWANANWWGVGPGAHSHVGGIPLVERQAPGRLRRPAGRGQSPAQDAELLDDADRALETVMLGLRLREGLPLDRLSRRRPAPGGGRGRPGTARRGGARTAAAPSSPIAGGCSPTPWSATSRIRGIRGHTPPVCDGGSTCDGAWRRSIPLATTSRSTG